MNAMTRASRLRRFGLARLALLAAATVVCAAWGAGHWLTNARPQRVGAAPAELHALDVEAASASGSRLRGWFVPGAPGRGAVLLLHGIRGDRRAMLARASWLAREGRAALLFDFSAHGESDGERVGFGAREALDARAMLAELRRRAPGERIAVIGQSLGGAAALLLPAGAEPLDVDALVVEQVYATIEEATENRMRSHGGAFGGIAALCTPLVLAEGAWFAGVDARELQPIECIGRVRAALLVVAACDDAFTPLAESRRMFARAPAGAELWEVPALGHVDLHACAREAYEERVGEFLARHLDRPGR